MTNYTLIDNNQITNLRISDGAYRCYNLLLSMCYGDKNTCYPSIKYVATALGKSPRTVNRYIKELEKAKLIAKRRRGSISNIYTLIQKITGQAIQKVKEAVNKAKKAYNQSKYTKKQSTFNNFEQRNYDFAKLEDALLNGNCKSYNDCLLE